MFPWEFPQKPKPTTPREILVQRLRDGVPPELAARAAGIEWATIKDEPEIIQAAAEGEIVLFERARDGGVSGAVRAAMRYEGRTWNAKVEPNSGVTLEDYLRD